MTGVQTCALPISWGLVLLGVFLVIGVELLGIRSLSFAVGFYIPIATTLSIFTGGVVRWLAERGAKKAEEGDVSPGSLFASGLIAAGGIVGLMGIAVKLLENTSRPASWGGGAWIKEGVVAWGNHLPWMANNTAFGQWLAVFTFGLLAASLYHFARKKLD